MNALAVPTNPIKSGVRTAIGISWRPQLALAIERLADLDFVEYMPGESNWQAVLGALGRLRTRGVECLLHSTTLSLGGAQEPTLPAIKKLCSAAEQVGASLISDHIAFVRSTIYETGHLLPVQRTQQMIDVMVENIKLAQTHLNRPLALENIATLFDWPHVEMDEARFVSEIINRTNCSLLLDVSNLFANSVNSNFDPLEYMRRFPLEHLAYVHVAGGRYREGLYHDTHADPIPKDVLKLLRHLARLIDIPKVMIEIDYNFPGEAELRRQLDSITEAVSS